MFKTMPVIKYYYTAFLIVAVLFSSCIEEPELTFSEQAISSIKGADISIVYPEANGNTSRVVKINNVIENHVVNAISFSEEELKGVHIADAVKAFNVEYETFKKEFPESEQQWNASIEGEVLYHSPEIISIAMNSYLDTGGAHGNDNITFLNFNSETGDLYTNEDIINANEKLEALIKTYFEKEIVDSGSTIEDYFFGEPFHLPANIGFSEDGVIFLYNVYEIASYAQGYTEFIIPFEDIKSYLKVE